VEAGIQTLFLEKSPDAFWSGYCKPSMDSDLLIEDLQLRFNLPQNDKAVSAFTEILKRRCWLLGFVSTNYSLFLLKGKITVSD
jgi:hypothetical protein